MNTKSGAPHPPIFLIGFMCSGKTTLGRAVGSACGVEFIDLDDMIERSVKLSVSGIFAKYGEEVFRMLEKKALADVASRTDVIVACGGGTPCQPGAMELMNSCGTTIWLQPSRERMINRLLQGRRKRPLIAAISDAQEMGDFLDSMTKKREPHYSKAMETFDSTYLDDQDEVASSVQRFINLYLK